MHLFGCSIRKENYFVRSVMADGSKAEDMFNVKHITPGVVSMHHMFQPPGANGNEKQRTQRGEAAYSVVASFSRDLCDGHNIPPPLARVVTMGRLTVGL